MRFFDLLFLASALVLLVSMARLASLLIRHRSAKLLGSRIGAGVAVYFAALLTVSAISPARIYSPGRPRCSDDWCLAVTGAEREGLFVTVRITISSQARRVTQRERGVSVHLTDDRGRRYEPVAESGPALETPIGSGEVFEVTRTFRPAAGARSLALTMTHSQGPGLVVIADEGSLFHRPLRMELPVR